MSLRRKLILFFLGTVVLPVVLLAYLLIDLSQDSRQDRAEADLRAGMLSVHAIYEVAGQIAPREADRLADRFAGPLRTEDERRAARILEQELGSRVIAAITVRDERGRVLAEGGPDRTLARARSPVQSESGERLGSVEVMTIASATFLSRIEQQTDQTAAIVREGDVIAATDPVSVSADQVVPSTPDDLAAFEVDASTGDDLGAALDLHGEPGETRLLLLSSTEGGLLTDPLAVIGALALLLITVLAIAALILNRLRRRLNGMLDMTRRIGQGDFSGELSEDGNDEMAELAREINRMRSQIALQMEELRSQRHELDQSVRRLGNAFASGLDRDALLQVLIETATAACHAQRGKILIDPEGDPPAVITTGTDPGGLDQLLTGVTARAAGDADATAILDTEAGAHAMAEVMFDPQHPREQLCVVVVARKGDEFTGAEGEALSYLIGQCSISIENIALHERVATQAVTDDLTGLANHRALNAWIEREIQRVYRYREPLSLLMIDIDEFKRINDTFGHLEGDRVLREVAAVIQRESREVDEAARYGGDEFVLALPGTGSIGAFEVAERIRRGIAEIRADAGGEMTDPISASIGVASTDPEIAGVTELIAEADDALYRAKAEGKDRVATAARA